VRVVKKKSSMTGNATGVATKLDVVVLCYMLSTI